MPSAGPGADRAAGGSARAALSTALPWSELGPLSFSLALMVMVTSSKRLILQ